MRMLLKDGKDKVVTLSYDDGVVQDIRLSEIAKKYGLKITFNINTGLYMQENAKRDKFYGRLKLSEAQKLYLNSGNEVAVHTLTHPFLVKLSDTEIINEVMTDRKNILKQYGCTANGMAYPQGSYNDRVIEILRKCGIAYSRTTKSTENFEFPTDWITLHPTCHHNNPKLMELAEQFVQGKRLGRSRMFYLWGHSYEFDDNDNWDIIEDFAEFIGNRGDIWYATNIEVYNYVMAYNRLKKSPDSRRIFNPSIIDVWALDEDGVFCIKSGETVSR
ncbi:MAG: polysaccharide deacetylase family protein [Firmicutes bacterium]|nr:polysaccharide deacetylase family protein [Bacillota bacterium]